MKEYKAPTLTVLSIPEEDVLSISMNLMLGGKGGIEGDSNEIFGGFHAY